MQVINTLQAPAAIGTYSQAIKCGDTVYLSGQIPLNPTTMELIGSDIQEQIQQTFVNLAAVCEAAGGSLHHLVKINVYLLDLAHFPLINEVMQTLFTHTYPARAVLGVAALPRGAQVEIDGIMVLSH